MEKAKKKKILFWVLVPLISALIIAGIVIGSVMSCAPKSGGPNTPVNPGPGDDPVDDPPIVDPPHQHKWVWKATLTEHYEETLCGDDHEPLERNRGPHEYDNNDDKICNVCEYERKLPTKQDKIEVDFGEDGNASIGGLKDTTVTDLVIAGTVTDSDGKDVDVVEISQGAFKDQNGLKYVTILDGIKTIGKSAFEGCSELESVTLPKTVEFIDHEAFKNCKSLKTISIPADNPYYMGVYNCIIRIEDKCLIVGCSGSTIPIRRDSSGYIVTSIGEGAFYGSGIEEIVIPSNITEIGAHAFDNCTTLTKFTSLEGITQINGHTFNGCTALTTVVLNDRITAIGQNAFAGCASLDNVVMPAKLETILQYTFQDCTSLKNITLNEGLRSIGRAAFSRCTNLESITLPKSISGIDNTAFSGCTRLKEIIFAGTEEEWNAKSMNKQSWIPNGIEVTFAETDEAETPDTGDGDDTTDDADNSSGSGDGTDN